MKLKFWTPTRGVVIADVKLQRVIKRYAMLTCGLKNSDFRAAPGQRFIIEGMYHNKGFNLELPQACPCCGLAGRVTSVPWDHVLIAGEPPAEPSKKAIEAADLLHEHGGLKLKRLWEALGRDHWWWRKEVDPMTGEIIGIEEEDDD